MKKIFILTGEPSGDKLASTVISKLKQSHPDIDYLCVGGTHLSLLGIKHNNFVYESQMIKNNIVSKAIENLKNDLIKKEINPAYEYVMSNKDNFETYIKLTDDLKSSKQKTRKQIQRTLENIANGNKHFKTQMVQFQSMLDIKNEITNNQNKLENLNNHFHKPFNNIVKFLCLEVYYFLKKVKF